MHGEIVISPYELNPCDVEAEVAEALKFAPNLKSFYLLTTV